ncbi:acid--CoA ligase [Marmoricola endophyticus]|uniref:Acid--CoA ligase n=1 Tax=Marmoricola endophyticus TaxID=2040280 RepID=A0A917F527_9ACTN|nr:AMP-binding protein [Marmoricola endophyticus]GGF44169.1 acid--CoA ligase [Marmoricola endophyticus]
MSETTIAAALDELERRDPDRVAVRCGGAALTRRELGEWTRRLAAHWRRGGLAVDDHVSIVLESGIGFVVAAVAAWRAGATPQPVPPSLPEGERRDVLELAAAPLLVDHDPPLVDDLPPCAELPDLAASCWKAPTSSGSTGRPKIVRAAAPATWDPDRSPAAFVPRDAVQLVAAPLHHAAPFTYAMRGLMCGHTLVLMTAFDPAEWLRLVETHDVTWGLLSPTSMLAVWRSPRRASAEVSSLESVLHLGARCPPWLKREWLGWLGPERVVEVYAGTESQGLTCIGGEEWLAHPGSVGRPTGGTRLRVVRADGTGCGFGETGEVLMRRDRETYSYLGAEPVVRDGWHTLGDAGHLDEQGYLFLGDRLEDAVRTPDGTVWPADVEGVIERHPAVRSCLVVERSGQVHAVVETAPEDLADIGVWAAGRLLEVQRPATWQQTTSRLRDDMGKARRAEWRG